MNASPSPAAAWGVDWAQRACQQCQSRLLVDGPHQAQCPWCGSAGALSSVEQLEVPTPELRVVPRFSRDDVAVFLHRRVAIVPALLRPEDLDADLLEQRLHLVYVPRWLVDSDVRATWHCQVGFDYDVETHRERRVGNGWDVQKINRTHVDWEPRHGTFARRIDNVSVPALADQAGLIRTLGPFDESGAQPYQPGDAQRAVVMLPDVSREEAWRMARLGLTERVSARVKEACGAQHIDAIELDDQHDNEHWTLQLLPVWTTHYRTSEGTLEVIRVQAQSGQPTGTLRTDHKRARLLVWGLRLVGVLAVVGGIAIGELGSFFFGVLIAVFAFNVGPYYARKTVNLDKGPPIGA